MARLTAQVTSALLYALSSLLIIFVNKIVLTVYGFPSFMTLALGQLIMTMILLQVLRAVGFLSFPNFSMSVMIDVFPLPLFSFFNMVTGLGGTKSLNLPMLTVLRRFSVPMTMVLEFIILRRVSSTGVQFSVLLMIIGALVAAADDLAFDLHGYVYTLLNDVFTALNGVVVKHKLENKNLGTYGLMYYNTLFSIIIIIPLMCLNWDRDVTAVLTFSGWTNPGFIFQFGLSSILGFVLNYSTYWCTHVNSALTTTVVGCLKNVLSTYVGMALGGDYVYTIINFVGLNVSVFGSLLYSVIKYFEQEGKTGTSKTMPEKSPNGQDHHYSHNFNGNDTPPTSNADVSVVIGGSPSTPTIYRVGTDV